MKPGVIRVIAVCVFRRGGSILVEEGRDPTKREVFYRPLGGEVEFGEPSREAVSRELREEIGAELRDVRLLGTVENIFTFDGEPGHEIVMVYEADLADASLYEREEIAGRESQGEPIKARWMPLRGFRHENAPPLYPEGLLGLIERQAETGDERCR